MKLAIALLMSMLVLRPAFAQELCDQDKPRVIAASAKRSLDFVADTICKHEVKLAARPDAAKVIDRCADSAKSAAVDWWKHFKGGWEFIGDMASAPLAWAVGKVAKTWNRNPDATLAAEDSAEENAKADATLLQAAMEYLDAAKKVVEATFDEFSDNATLIGKTMKCAPWELRAEVACEILMRGALEGKTIESYLNVANKGAEATKAVRDFTARTGQIDELKGASLSERLTLATNALQEEKAFTMVERFGKEGNLKKRIDPITKEETLHFDEISVINGEKVRVMRDLPRDAKTKAIDANFETGKKVAGLVTKESQGSFLLFADVNNLGKVNYFKGGTQAGDKYLERIGENIRAHLRPEDRFFKNGGDELVIILKTKDPNQAKEVMRRIHKAIDEDKELQAMFAVEHGAKKAEVAAANVASGTKETAEQLAMLKESEALQPSLSIGSARIKGDWNTDVARANQQADLVKVQLKSDLGQDISKYANVASMVEKRTTPSLGARPRVLDPVE